jgi:hypothetical protein
LVVLRYIERNPLRAKLVEQAEDWSWSSLKWLGNPAAEPVRLDIGAVPRGREWTSGVNSVAYETEVDRVRKCVRRDRPFGREAWVKETATRLGLEFRLVGTLMAGGDENSVDVEPGAVADASLILRPALYFAGVVVDEQGKPIRAVQIAANLTLPRGSAGVERTASNSDGSFLS